MSEINFVDYRNALYQGGFLKGRREGKGILITDSGQIFAGTWKNDVLNDRALIWLDEKTHVIGQFNRGEMDGQFIFRDNKRIFYATFSNDRLNGKILHIDRVQQTAKSMQFRNMAYQVLQNKDVLGVKDNQVFLEMLGSKPSLPTLQQYIQQQMLSDNTFENKTLNTGATYIGFKNGLSVEKLGFVLSKDQLISFGVYKQTILNGLGWLFSNKNRYQGVFKNGLLNGLGLKYQMLQNKYVIGNFVDGDIKEMDYVDNKMTKDPELNNMRRVIHLKSIYFFNSFVESASLLKYNGYEQVVSKSNPQQEYLYPEVSIKKKSEASKNSSSNLLTKSSYKDSSRILQNQRQVASPLKKSLKKMQDPEIMGVHTLLNKIQSKNYPGSLNSDLRQYQEIQSLKKKSSKRNK